MVKKKEELEEHVSNQFLEPPKKYKPLIDKANILGRRLRENPLTESLLDNLLESFRKHYNAYFVLAGGNVKPHGKLHIVPSRAVGADASLEVAHLAGHAVPHIVDYALELLQHKKILELPTAFVDSIPLLGTFVSCGAKMLEIWFEHELIHEVEKQLGKLTGYSETVRDAVCQYAICEMIIALSPILEQKKTEEHYAEISILIFSQYLDSLSKIPHAASADTLAKQWSRHAINAFMLNNLLPPIHDTSEEADESVNAHLSQFRDIFTSKEPLPQLNWFEGIFVPQYYPQTTANYNEKDFPYPLWGAIYSQFLAPYAHRISVPDVWSEGFAGYSKSDLDKLRRCYAKMDMALNYLQKNLMQLQLSPAFGDVLILSNRFFVFAIKEMATVMCWSDMVELSKIVSNMKPPCSFKANASNKSHESHKSQVQATIADISSSTLKSEQGEAEIVTAVARQRRITQTPHKIVQTPQMLFNNNKQPSQHQKDLASAHALRPKMSMNS
jgi:hypothetical protein